MTLKKTGVVRVVEPSEPASIAAGATDSTAPARPLVVSSKISAKLDKTSTSKQEPPSGPAGPQSPTAPPPPPPAGAATKDSGNAARPALVKQNSSLASKISSKLDKSCKEASHAAAAPPPPTAPPPPPPSAQTPTESAGVSQQSEPEKPRKRLSGVRAAADMAMKPAWERFLAASEVDEAVHAYQTLRTSCNVPEGAYGRVAFDAVMEATLVADVPHRTKSLMQSLAENWKLRPMAHSEVCVVVSGAGPVGLRSAVEAALMGMKVHVLEKRDIFSRVNILMLWQQTADDLIAYGARTFYPKFTNRNIGNAPLHLGTREIQVCPPSTPNLRSLDPDPHLESSEVGHG